MNPKKKPETSKTQQKKNLTIYVERYREIELYLTLLSRPLLTAVIPTTSVGSDVLFDKVEAEIKDFIETKLQVLTGMVQPKTATGLSDLELSALKLVASKIMTKEPAPVPMAVRVEPVEVPEPDVTLDEYTEEVEQELVTEDVVVERVDSPIAKRKKKAKPVDPSQIPQGVVLGEPTDTMKRSKPSGARPLPQPDSNYSMALAMQQAAAADNMFNNIQGQTGNAPVNLDAPLFR